MIPRTASLTIAARQDQSWQEQLSDLIREPGELCRLLELEPGDLQTLAAAQESFELRVPRSFVARMRKGDPHDPLLLQVLPQAQEMLEQAGFNADPLAECGAQPANGILHKYHGRLLLLVASACAINCRYCFRRHFPYEQHRQSRSEWQAALDVIAADSSIGEVIFSGGDPLMAPDRQLAWFADQIARIPHVRTLRVHSRLPIVLPDRIDEHCLAWLRQERLRVIMVLHSNHPNEIDESVIAACARLRAAGVTLLNQAVLLRGINDQVELLAQLSERLFDAGVLPYYLHLLDKVAGAQHFDLPESEARRLHASLRARLPGYLVPRLAREVPGESGKAVIA